jgi:hypothetical protein
MTAIALVGLLAVFLALDVAALGWGVDSRLGPDDERR